MPRLLGLLALVLLIIVGCDGIVDDNMATVRGEVVNALTNKPVVGATLQIPAMGKEWTSDSTGHFEYTMEVDSAATFEVVAFKTGYQSDGLRIQAVGGQSISIPAFRLMPATDAPIPGEGSGPIASITLAERSSEAIGVTGGGSDETATLVFQALDAQGQPLTEDQAVDLGIRIANGPGGGEALSDATIRTDENGQAATTLTSGERSGVVQVEVTAEADGRTVRSNPITLVIHGGLPHIDAFSTATSAFNIPGWNRHGETTTISTIVADRYNNPVQPGTQVYFTTTGGVIGGSAVTDENGQASVTLTSANPRPFHPQFGVGYAEVTASTSDENQQTIEANANDGKTVVLFSGEPTLSLDTPGLSLGTYQYSVDDINSNPLAAGTTITVEVEGENVETTGQTDVTLDDTLFGGAGKTFFTFSIRPEDEEKTSRIDEIKIRAEGPNGTVEATRPGALRLGADVKGKK